jgi:PDZ domain/BON domain
MECPDCDCPVISLTDNRGNGKCSTCHGTGIDAADQAFNILSDEHPCYKCNSSGDCPTCQGTGEIETDDSSLHASAFESGEAPSFNPTVSGTSWQPDSSSGESSFPTPTVSGAGWHTVLVLAVLVLVVGWSAIRGSRPTTPAEPTATIPTGPEGSGTQGTTMPPDQAEGSTPSDETEPPTLRSASDLESEIRSRLTHDGFWKIGVSAGRGGDVFLAGTVCSDAEVDEVVDLVKRVPGVTDVQFPNPEICKQNGRPYLGIRTPAAPGIKGALISEVDGGSPAFQAGFTRGDVITKLDGEVVTNSATLHRILGTCTPGQRLQITVIRQGTEQVLIVRLGEQRRRLGG